MNGNRTKKLSEAFAMTIEVIQTLVNEKPEIWGKLGKEEKDIHLARIVMSPGFLEGKPFLSLYEGTLLMPVELLLEMLGSGIPKEELSKEFYLEDEDWEAVFYYAVRLISRKEFRAWTGLPDTQADLSQYRAIFNSMSEEEKNIIRKNANTPRCHPIKEKE